MEWGSGEKMNHGSCFAQTVLRNATMLRLKAPHGTAQVKRLRQDRLGKIGTKNLKFLILPPLCHHSISPSLHFSISPSVSSEFL